MKTNKRTKRVSWLITGFYLLIAFEFFYMASPIALYFYSVYKPGLNILSSFPSLSWLTNFFLPHIASDTKSTVLNMMNDLGIVFLAVGLLTFIICAAQVYYNKIFKKGVVTGGIYRIIRHPQYTGFILSSFGMLLIWPRFLILITFIAVLFIYYFLARLEERECESKFGDDYRTYKGKTNMFLPFKIPGFNWISLKKVSRTTRNILQIATFSLVVFLSVIIAQQIRIISVNTLYATYSENEINLSITKNNEEQIDDIIKIALSNPEVNGVLQLVKEQEDFCFLNYILPGDMFYVSEIPMYIPEDTGCNYLTAESKDKNLIKVIFTKAISDNNKEMTGKEILLRTKFTQAIIEVWLNKISGKVTQIIYPENEKRYKNIPVPVF